MKWPWTSRARLDDALQANAEHKKKIADLEAENRHLVNQIFMRHGVRPVYAEPEGTSPLPLPVIPAAPVDPMQQEAPTVINEVRRGGARSAREIAAGVEKVLDRRHKEATGKIKPQSYIPPAMKAVAEELEAVLTAPSNGNGNH